MTRSGRFGLSFSAVALVLAAQGAAGAAAPQRVTQPVQVNKEDLAPTRTYSSPYVLVDPGRQLNVVAAFVEMRARTCGLLRSSDGGQTWKRLDASPSPPSYPFCFHTSGAAHQTPLAFGRDGTLYYALAGWDTQDGGPGRNVSVLLARSTNLGDTWTTAVVRDARGKQEAEVESNRPVNSVAVDTKSGDRDIVYVAWRTNYPQARPQRPSFPMVAASTDGGRTFSAPVSAVGSFFESPEVRSEALKALPPPTTSPPPPAAPPTTAAGQSPLPTTPQLQPATPQPPQTSTPTPPRDAPGNFGGGNPAITGDAKGNLYVLWARATANIQPAPEQPMYLSRSGDKGKTFTIVGQVSPPNRSHGAPVLRWSPEGGSEGTLHAVYQAKRGPYLVDDIFHRRSTDGGKTWSEATRLPDSDPNQQISNFLPNLSVAPNGRLDAAWFDFRNDPGTFVNDVYYASSTDNGMTWSQNVRITDRVVNRKIGPWSNNFDMRQPPGVASTEDFALLGWDDTRNGDPVGQAQDIFASAVQHSTIGGTSNAVKYAIAGFLGLLLVGLLLLGISVFAQRRVGGPPPDAETVPARDPVGVS